MNIKAVIALGGIILAIIGWGELRHYQGKSEQRNIDLLVRPDTSASVPLERIIKKLPAETLGIAAKTVKPPVHTSNHAPKPPSPSISPALAVKCDSLQTVIDSLLIPREVEVTTSNGERILANYDPPTDNFTIIVNPVEIELPTERYIARNIPAVEEPAKNFWLGFDGLYAGGPGMLGTIGFKELGFKVGLVSDHFAWGFEIHHDL